MVPFSGQACLLLLWSSGVNMADGWKCNPMSQDGTTGACVNATRAGGANLRIGQPISRVLHQIWISRVHMPDELQQLLQLWRQRAHAAGWEHWLWTTKESEQLMTLHFPELVRTYRSYARAVMRADAVRLAILMVHGGAYLDLDFAPRATAMQELEQGLSMHSLLLLGGGGSNTADTIPNGFLVSREPGHSLLGVALGLLPEALRISQQQGTARKIAGVMESTGPCLLAAAWHAYTSSPCAAVNGNTSRRNGTLWINYTQLEARVAIHLAASSWQNTNQQGVSHFRNRQFINKSRENGQWTLVGDAANTL